MQRRDPKPAGDRRGVAVTQQPERLMGDLEVLAEHVGGLVVVVGVDHLLQADHVGP
jgi:hypothetical protein